MEYIVIAVVVLIGLYLILSYNSLIRVRNRVRESFRGIDIYLQQRFDALSQMAETVAAYTAHERETLRELTEIRQGFYPNLPEHKKIELYNQLEKLTSSLRVESYPEDRDL